MDKTIQDDKLLAAYEESLKMRWQEARLRLRELEAQRAHDIIEGQIRTQIAAPRRFIQTTMSQVPTPNYPEFDDDDDGQDGRSSTLGKESPEADEREGSPSSLEPDSDEAHWSPERESFEDSAQWTQSLFPQDQMPSQWAPAPESLYEVFSDDELPKPSTMSYPDSSQREPVHATKRARSPSPFPLDQKASRWAPVDPKSYEDFDYDEYLGSSPEDKRPRLYSPEPSYSPMIPLDLGTSQPESSQPPYRPSLSELMTNRWDHEQRYLPQSPPYYPRIDSPSHVGDFSDIFSQSDIHSDQSMNKEISRREHESAESAELNSQLPSSHDPPRTPGSPASTQNWRDRYIPDGLCLPSPHLAPHSNYTQQYEAENKKLESQHPDESCDDRHTPAVIPSQRREKTPQRSPDDGACAEGVKKLEMAG